MFDPSWLACSCERNTGQWPRTGNARDPGMATSAGAGWLDTSLNGKLKFKLPAPAPRPRGPTLLSGHLAPARGGSLEESIVTGHRDYPTSAKAA